MSRNSLENNEEAIQYYIYEEEGVEDDKVQKSEWEIKREKEDFLKELMQPFI